MRANPQAIRRPFPQAGGARSDEHADLRLNEIVATLGRSATDAALAFS